MLNEREELFASTLDSLQMSSSINIQNAGMKDRLQLCKGESELEFMYSTEIYLATPDDYIYTKVTSI